MPQLTLSLDEWNEQLRLRQEAEARATKLEAELVEAKRTDPAGRVWDLEQLARNAMSVLAFAVANLPPESVRGWPWSDLYNFAQRMRWLPAFSTDDRDLANEWMAFAAEAEKLEATRRSEVSGERLT
jgi:hypothetical protein